MRGELFRDEDYAELHRSDKGMDSVPPSLLATALVRRSLLPMRYNSPWGRSCQDSVLLTSLSWALIPHR